MPSSKRSKSRPRTPTRRPRRRAAPRTSAPPRFVGRDASPVLDKYPPKEPGLAPKAPPPKVPAAASSIPVLPANPAPSGPAAPAAPGSVIPLVTLERPFDVDEFAQQLGATSIEVTVPREDLPEVLRRVSEFMGFGIYVYEFTVRPAPSELLKSFILSLRRVDFRAAKGEWAPFEERGRSDSPFGPDGRR